MTAAVPVSVLDPRTQDDLRPPCQCTDCDNPAEWWMRIRCGCGAQGVGLFCGPHRDYFTAGELGFDDVGCRRVTRDYVVLSEDRL